MTEGLLLVLARAEDSSVRTLSLRAPGRVAHASMADMSAPGWRHVIGAPERATACAAGRTIEATQIAAVLCRIARVTADDLDAVHADDREYAAAETTAFLRAWLAQFQGIRCNEPTWMSLAGPSCHPLQWARITAALDVPMSPGSHERRADAQTATAVVAGREVFGVMEPELIGYSLRIAAAVKARSLAVRFVRKRHWSFESAEACPELDEPSGGALLQDLLAGSA